MATGHFSHFFLGVCSVGFDPWNIGLLEVFDHGESLVGGVVLMAVVYFGWCRDVADLLVTLNRFIFDTGQTSNLGKQQVRFVTKDFLADQIGLSLSVEIKLAERGAFNGNGFDSLVDGVIVRLVATAYIGQSEILDAVDGSHGLKEEWHAKNIYTVMSDYVPDQPWVPPPEPDKTPRNPDGTLRPGAKARQGKSINISKHRAAAAAISRTNLRKIFLTQMKLALEGNTAAAHFCATWVIKEFWKPKSQAIADRIEYVMPDLSKKTNEDIRNMMAELEASEERDNDQCVES